MKRTAKKPTRAQSACLEFAPATPATFARRESAVAHVDATSQPPGHGSGLEDRPCRASLRGRCLWRPGGSETSFLRESGLRGERNRRADRWHVAARSDLESRRPARGREHFHINLADVHDRLQQLPQVDEVQVERKMPAEIDIRIVERKPIAWITARKPGFRSLRFRRRLSGGRTRRSDERKEVITGISRFAADHRLHRVESLESGKVVESFDAKAALDLLRLSTRSFMQTRFQIREIDVSKGYCLLVTDKNHTQVTFGFDDLERQLQRLEQFLVYSDDSKRELATVNLLVQRNIPVTFAKPAGGRLSTTRSIPEGIGAKNFESDTGLSPERNQDPPSPKVAGDSCAPAGAKSDSGSSREKGLSEMASSDLMVGLEIGTSKICVVVGEGRPDGTIKILGVGQAPSRGVRKGEIVDFETAMKCVHEAVVDAEQKSDVMIRSVYVGVAGVAHSEFQQSRLRLSAGGSRRDR